MRFCHPKVNEVIKNGPADKIYTKNTHAQSMPRAEEYPEICKLISVVTTCSVKMLGAGIR